MPFPEGWEVAVPVPGTVVAAALTGGGRNGCRGERWAWISADV